MIHLCYTSCSDSLQTSCEGRKWCH